MKSLWAFITLILFVEATFFGFPMCYILEALDVTHPLWVASGCLIIPFFFILCRSLPIKSANLKLILTFLAAQMAVFFISWYGYNLMKIYPLTRGIHDSERGELLERFDAHVFQADIWPFSKLNLFVNHDEDSLEVREYLESHGLLLKAQ
jgi:hypothetical protein